MTSIASNGIVINFQPTDAPIESIIVKNPKGYLDIKVTIDTTARKGRRRVKLETANGAVFVGVNEVEALKNAIDKIVDFGVDLSASRF